MDIAPLLAHWPLADHDGNRNGAPKEKVIYLLLQRGGKPNEHSRGVQNSFPVEKAIH